MMPTVKPTYPLVVTWPANYASISLMSSDLGICGDSAGWENAAGARIPTSSDKAMSNGVNRRMRILHEDSEWVFPPFGIEHGRQKGHCPAKLALPIPQSSVISPTFKNTICSFRTTDVRGEARCSICRQFGLLRYSLRSFWLAVSARSQRR
jgi:hypothetical protein